MSFNSKIRRIFDAVECESENQLITVSYEFPKTGFPETWLFHLFWKDIENALGQYVSDEKHLIEGHTETLYVPHDIQLEVNNIPCPTHMSMIFKPSISYHKTQLMVLLKSGENWRNRDKNITNTTQKQVREYISKPKSDIKGLKHKHQVQQKTTSGIVKHVQHTSISESSHTLPKRPKLSEKTRPILKDANKIQKVKERETKKPITPNLIAWIENSKTKKNGKHRENKKLLSPDLVARIKRVRDKKREEPRKTKKYSPSRKTKKTTATITTAKEKVAPKSEKNRSMTTDSNDASANLTNLSPKKNCHQMSFNQMKTHYFQTIETKMTKAVALYQDSGYRMPDSQDWDFTRYTEILSDDQITEAMKFLSYFYGLYFEDIGEGKKMQMLTRYVLPEWAIYLFTQEHNMTRKEALEYFSRREELEALEAYAAEDEDEDV